MKVSCAAAVAPTPPGAMSVTWYRERDGCSGEGEGGGRGRRGSVEGVTQPVSTEFMRMPSRARPRAAVNVSMFRAA